MRATPKGASPYPPAGPVWSPCTMANSSRFRPLAIGCIGHIMDFWERSGDHLLTNWVHIDMIHVFKQMGVDVFERYHRFGQGQNGQES